MPFTPTTAASIAQGRQHALGDLLRRTARRYPDKLAVVARRGGSKATFLPIGGGKVAFLPLPGPAYSPPV